MRLLCDQNVDAKYITAFEHADEITVTTVGDVLSVQAADTEIVAYAEEHDWVVFTTDDDFYTDRGEHGLVLYSQLEDPRPGDVVDAIQRIDAAYASQSEVLETVPDGWI